MGNYSDAYKRKIVGEYLTEIYKAADLASGQTLTRAEFGRRFALDQPSMHRYMSGKILPSNEFLDEVARQMGTVEEPDMTVFERLGFTPMELMLRKIQIMWPYLTEESQKLLLSQAGELLKKEEQNSSPGLEKRHFSAA